MILLDTHAWIWLVSDPDRLGAKARAALQKTTSKAIASISCWELAMLSSRGRIELDRDPISWMEDSLATEGIELLPLTPAVAVASTQLGDFHGDPADRLIVGTALVHSAVLISKDDRIRGSDRIEIVW